MKHQIPADVVAEKILGTYSELLQVLKTIEELSECSAALGKHLAFNLHHSAAQKAHVIDEIADATIMLRQMRLLYGFEAVDAAIERKLNRTLERIEPRPLRDK